MDTIWVTMDDKNRHPAVAIFGGKPDLGQDGTWDGDLWVELGSVNQPKKLADALGLQPSERVEFRRVESGEEHLVSLARVLETVEDEMDISRASLATESRAMCRKAEIIHLRLRQEFKQDTKGTG